MSLAKLQGLVLPSAGGASAAGKGNPMYPATPGGKALPSSSAASSPDRPDARRAASSYVNTGGHDCSTLKLQLMSNPKAS